MAVNYSNCEPCGCDPCGCSDVKEKLDRAYDRAMKSINTIVSTDGRVFVADGGGVTTPPLPIPTAEQLASIADVGGDITAIEKDLEDQGADIAQLKTDVSKNAGDIGDLSVSLGVTNNTVQNAETNITTLSSQVGTINSQISQIQTKDAAQDLSIASLQNGAYDMNRAIGNLQTSMAEAETAIDDAETNITALQSDLTTLGGRVDAADSDIAGIETTVNNHTSQITTLSGNLDTATGRIDALEPVVSAAVSDIDSLETALANMDADIDSLSTTVSGHTADISEIETNISGLLDEVIDSVSMVKPSPGNVKVVISHEDGTTDESAVLDLGLIEEGGVQILSTTTARAFRLRFTLTDGSSWDSNDFVIPAGGGTEVVVTSISLVNGTGAGTMAVSIGLSDGSEIKSNDYEIVRPSDLNSMNSAISSLQSTVAGHTTQIGSLTTRVTNAESSITAADSSIDSLDTRVTALEGAPGYSLPTASATVKGGVKVGSGLQIATEVLSISDDVLTTADEGSEYLGTGYNPTALELSVDEQNNLTATLVRGVGNLSGSVALPSGGGSAIQRYSIPTTWSPQRFFLWVRNKLGYSDSVNLDIKDTYDGTTYYFLQCSISGCKYTIDNYVYFPAHGYAYQRSTSSGLITTKGTIIGIRYYPNVSQPRFLLVNESTEDPEELTMMSNPVLTNSYIYSTEAP